jgi:curved DNA-binding protein CbpA
MAIERDAYEVLQLLPTADQQIVQAAYRILAAKWHPDHDPSPTANVRMVELNAAYEAIGTEERRVKYDQERQRARMVQKAIVPPFGAPGAPPPTDVRGEPIDFGRYAGWTIEQLARHDPDYLRWLSRSSSGFRYRRRIEEALAKLPPPLVVRPEERELSRR